MCKEPISAGPRKVREENYTLAPIRIATRQIEYGTRTGTESR